MKSRNTIKYQMITNLKEKREKERIEEQLKEVSAHRMTVLDVEGCSELL